MEYYIVNFLDVNTKYRVWSIVCKLWNYVLVNNRNVVHYIVLKHGGVTYGIDFIKKYNIKELIIAGIDYCGESDKYVWNLVHTNIGLKLALKLKINMLVMISSDYMWIDYDIFKKIGMSGLHRIYFTRCNFVSSTKIVIPKSCVSFHLSSCKNINIDNLFSSFANSNIKRLFVDSNEEILSKQHLKNLISLKLESLALYSYNYIDADVEYLSNFPELKYLDIAFQNFTNYNNIKLSFPKLQYLDMDIKDLSISAPKLQTFITTGNIPKSITNFKKLTCVNISYSYISKDTILHLNELSLLKLNIDNCGHQNVLKYLNIPTLTYLDFHNTVISDDDLLAISHNCPLVTHLDVSQVKILGSYINKFKNLECLLIDCTNITLDCLLQIIKDSKIKKIRVDDKFKKVIKKTYLQLVIL